MESQRLVLNLFHPDSPHFIYHGTNVGILTVWNLSVHIVYLRTGKKKKKTHKVSYVTHQVHCAMDHDQISIISLLIALVFTGKPEECFWSQRINFSSEIVPSSPWKVFDFSSLPIPHPPLQIHSGKWVQVPLRKTWRSVILCNCGSISSSLLKWSLPLSWRSGSGIGLYLGTEYGFMTISFQC